jgi:Fe-S oxidoreductase
MAAVEAIEDAGFAVSIPPVRLCCGRPLFDYGMLTTARAYLTRIVHVLRDDIDSGTPVVVLEPSCLAVFKDELCGLLADDPRAARLKTLVCSLGDFLSRHADAMPALRLPRRAIVHGHCHQKALGGIQGEAAVLRRMGIDAQTVDSGCCGMAGSFGFEASHYEVSQAIGERRLLPAVRQAPLDALIVADGFSCREQIAQSTNRRALHLADVIALARRQPREVPAYYPEQQQVAEYPASRVAPAAVAALALIGLGAALLGVQAGRKRRRAAPKAT